MTRKRRHPSSVNLAKVNPHKEVALLARQPLFWISLEVAALSKVNLPKVNFLRDKLRAGHKAMRKRNLRLARRRMRPPKLPRIMMMTLVRSNGLSATR